MAIKISKGRYGLRGEVRVEVAEGCFMAFSGFKRDGQLFVVAKRLTVQPGGLCSYSLFGAPRVGEGVISPVPCSRLTARVLEDALGEAVRRWAPVLDGLKAEGVSVDNWAYSLT